MPHMSRYLARLTANRHERDEVLQDTLRKALEHADRYTQGTNFEGWLRSIAHRTFIDMKRRQSRRTRTETHDEMAFQGYPDPHDDFQKIYLKDIEEFMEELPSVLSSALRAVVFEGMSYAEAARTLDCSVSSVKTNLHRARSMIKELLDEVPDAGTMKMPAMRI